MKKEKPLFHFEYVTDADSQKRKEETILNLKDEQKTDIIFNDENLYYIGNGHDFVRSFYKEYITKSGVEITYYILGDIWSTEDKEYKYDNNKFVDITPPVVEIKKIDWSTFSFPLVKNVSAKTISDSIKSIKSI